MLSRFNSVYDKLNHAMDGFPYKEIGISEEVKEQVICSSVKSLIICCLGLTFDFFWFKYSFNMWIYIIGVLWLHLSLHVLISLVL